MDLGSSRRVQGCAPLEENFVHFKVKCINLVHFESKIKRLDLWRTLCSCKQFNHKHIGWLYLSCHHHSYLYNYYNYFLTLFCVHYFLLKTGEQKMRAATINRLVDWRNINRHLFWWPNNFLRKNDITLVWKMFRQDVDEHWSHNVGFVPNVFRVIF